MSEPTRRSDRNGAPGGGRAPRRRSHGPGLVAGLAVVAGVSTLLPGCSGSTDPTSPNGGNPGAVPFTAATVTGSESSWTVRWTAPGTRRVRLFEGSGPTDATTPVGSGRGRGSLTVAGTTGVAREWFRLVPDRGRSLVVADRDLGLASDPNLRDIGGYRTSSGHWVRMGVVYRSQALHGLSAADLAVVDRLGITDVYDLRTPSEASGSPDARVPGSVYHLLNVFGTPGPNEDIATTTAGAQRYMVDMNVQFVTGSSDRAAFRTLLTDIADSTGAQLYNCTAGKDRTGWATAVILTLLGVPRSTVVQDYLLSNTYYFATPPIQSLVHAASPSEAPVLSSVLDVNRTYLQAGLDQVTRSYGSMDNYVVKGLGVSPTIVAKLRARLLVG